MTGPIPLAQFIQARRELEPPPGCSVPQAPAGAGTSGALAEDLAADMAESLPEDLPDQGATEPESDEANADRQQELEEAYARGRAEALAEMQEWWDDRVTAVQEITSRAQSEIEAGILASALNLVHAVSARHVREAAIDQLIRQVKEHLQQCADAVPLVTGQSDLGREVADQLQGAGIEVVSSFDAGSEEVLVRLGDTAFETMIGMWTQEIESTLP